MATRAVRALEPCGVSVEGAAVTRACREDLPRLAKHSDLVDGPAP